MRAKDDCRCPCPRSIGGLIVEGLGRDCRLEVAGPLRYDVEKQELVSSQAKLAYPIRDGIPIMLVDEARRLDEK